MPKVDQRDGTIGYLDGENFVAMSSFNMKLIKHVTSAGGSSGFIIEIT